MKNKLYLFWSATSVVASIVSCIALVPFLAMGFADRGTQISYIVTLALLFLFTFVSLFLTIHYRGKVAPHNAGHLIQVRRKINKHVITTLLVIILLITAFSAWSSF